MNTHYNRILPRDLFNEAKLLKCMGRLCLLIHDCMAPQGLMFEETGDPFKIAQTTDGSLTILNLHIYLNNTLLEFQTTYNSKANYPLYLVHEFEETEVFNEQGEFTQEFIDKINQLKTEQ